MMPSMVTIGMNYRVLPGKETIFERAFADVLTRLQSMPGHRQSRLYREVAESKCYLILSEWASREDFDAFVRSPEFARVVRWGSENVLAERPHHEIFEH